jgi:hypothetical protein
MRRRHPKVLYLYRSKNSYERTGDPHAWLDVDEDAGEDDPDRAPTSYAPRSLFPRIRVNGRAPRPDLFEFFENLKKRGVATEKIPQIDIVGPVSDDVVPIIFGEDHGGVYVRLDVARLLTPFMSPTQRLLPVHCDGELTPYLLLIDPCLRVWLPENWCYVPCEERSREFGDGDTLTYPVFPDTFSKDCGVHFVGNYNGLFLDLQVWTQLRKSISNLKQWWSTCRIVVDDALPSNPGMRLNLSR